MQGQGVQARVAQVPVPQRVPRVQRDRIDDRAQGRAGYRWLRRERQHRRAVAAACGGRSRPPRRPEGGRAPAPLRQRWSAEHRCPVYGGTYRLTDGPAPAEKHRTADGRRRWGLSDSTLTAGRERTPAALLSAGVGTAWTACALR